MNKVKILMTTDAVGGVFTYALELIKGLAPYQTEVHLAIMGPEPSSAQYQALDDIDGLRYYYGPYKLEWMDNPWEDVREAGKWLLQLKRAIQPDLVHLNAFAHGNLDWNMPVVMVAHSCVYSWHDGVKGGVPENRWNIYKTVVSEGLKSADMVIAPSRFMMQALQKHYGHLSTRKVIHNGRNVNGFHQAKKEPFIFSMGRIWDDGKNVKALIDAAEQIPYPIFIAGNNKGVYKKHTRENVHFLGQLSEIEIAHWLSKAPVFVLPVYYEPFGYTFLEAAFSKSALITGNIPSMREIWDDAACFTNPNDVDLLAKNINLLMNNEDLRENLAEKAYKRAIANFSREKMAHQYFDLYQQMAMQTDYKINRKRA